MSKALNSWWLRRGEGGRFRSLQTDIRKQINNAADIDTAYWKQMHEQAVNLAKAALTEDVFNHRLDVLWPDDAGNKSWHEATLVYREMLNPARWESENV